jgi:hypothetical protein
MAVTISASMDMIYAVLGVMMVMMMRFVLAL